MRVLPKLLGVVLPWLLVWAGCEGSAEVVGDPNGASTGIGGGVVQGGGDGEGGAGGGDGGSTSTGGVAALRLGVVANASSTDPAAGELALAELTAFAAGVRAAVVDLPWRDADAATIDALAARVDDYVARDVVVVLDLLIVDGLADLRPDSLAAEAWDSTASKDALAATISAVLAATGDDLTAVVLGRRVDAYLAAMPADEQALQTLIGEGVGLLEAAAIPQGVGLTYVGDQASSAYRGMAALGDTTALAYLPGLGLDQIPADLSHAKALDDMIEIAAGRPIHLYAAGYPSSDAVGSSADVQAQQLDGLFDALDSRRAAFPIVIVQQLHDWDGPACEALVAAQGLQPGDGLGDHLCSTGLREVDDEPKPAFSRFLQAAAHFAEP